MFISSVEITDHAIERGQAYGLDKKKILDLFQSARKQKTNFGREQYKFSKYGEVQSTVHYFIRDFTRNYPCILYTVRFKPNDIAVILTITIKGDIPRAFRQKYMNNENRRDEQRAVDTSV